MDTRRALELATQAGLDLCEVSPTANPPVCKILDYGKYKYEVKKKQKQAKKNQIVTVIKEIQFRPQTDTHDIDFKVKHIREFLEEGDKVRVSVRFRGREAAHAKLGHDLIKQIIDMVGNCGIVEQTPKMEGKAISMLFGPVAKPGKKATTQPTKPAVPAAKPKETASKQAGSSE